MFANFIPVIVESDELNESVDFVRSKHNSDRVISDDDVVHSDLAVPVIFSETVAQIVCLTLIMHRHVLIRGRGADDVVTHLVCLLMLLV